MVSQKALGGPRGGGRPQAFGATPPPALLLPHTRSSQHLQGVLDIWRDKEVQGLTKDGGSSLSSRSSQLQRTEGYTKQTPP